MTDHGRDPITGGGDSPAPGEVNLAEARVRRVIRVPPGAQVPDDYVVRDDDMMVGLALFEGPLDLLLHLIRRHKMDIFDIPMAVLTARYRAYLDTLEHLNIDIASDFIVMAATLMYIKSRTLLPRLSEDEDGDEAGEDPRNQLVQRLLEYQKYADAAQKLEQQPWLGRDVFVRDGAETAEKSVLEAGLVEVSVDALLRAFEQVLARVETLKSHRVDMDEVPVDAMIRSLIQRLRVKELFPLRELFEHAGSRGEIIAAFLAVLEVTKQGACRVMQHENGEVFLKARLDEGRLNSLLARILNQEG